MTEPFEMGVFALSGELRRLGPYRLLCQLATGGMGVIYLGRDPNSGRIAAVKTLLAPGGISAEARKRFDREVTVARRVRNKYTARVLSSDVEAGRPWMAMEYIPAPSLEALVVRSGPLGDEQAVRWIASGTVQALAELHGKGIVHRDVKPLNILLSADGPKVIDFGISHASDLTSTKLTLGTVAFAAPEQAEGQSSTPASDIYALGVTLYYVACGKLPYPETDEPLQQLNYVRRAAVNLDGLPEGLRGVMGDCLAVRPDDRPTAQQLVRRFSSGTAQALPTGWTSLIGWYAEEGRRLQRAVDQAEAETVTRGWTKFYTDDGNNPPGPKEPPPVPKPNNPKPGNRPPNNRPPNNRPAKPGPSGNPGQKNVWGPLSAVLVVILGILWLAQRNSNDSPSASTSSPSYSSPAPDPYTDVSGSSSDGISSDGISSDTSSSDGISSDSSSSDGSDSYTSGTSFEPSPTPSSPEDLAFGDVVVDDCLSNYNDTSLDWTPSTPSVNSCSDTGAYYLVTSVEHSGSCSSDDMTWFHTNDDDTETNLCLNRNYVSGQCMFADAEGQSLSVYRNAVTPCGAGIPDKYQYTVQITRVYQDGAPDDACGQDRKWTTDNGTAYCGRAIWKRHGLPDV